MTRALCDEMESVMPDSDNPLYNPLAVESIAESLARKIRDSTCGPLPPSSPFTGAGVYMIYYRGDFPAYELIARANRAACAQPIYVGKAVPKGGRIGVAGNNETGQELYHRLKEHADSIQAATNLHLGDFSCRYLAVEHLFIGLAEHTLINAYKPVWNYFGGFGNHDPGGGRYAQKRSSWDTVHPGRTWAARLQDNKLGAEYLSEKMRDHLHKAESGAVPPIPFDDDSPTEIEPEK